MDSLLSSEIRNLIGEAHYRPSVSIILPFEPKMSLEKELTQELRSAVDQVERDLRGQYPAEISRLIVQKLGAIIRTLNFNTHKKSIAIYVSPLFQKVLYLDIPVEKKIMIDESFEIRDLVYCKKQVHKYLVLLLSENEYRIYLGNASSFIRILSVTKDSLRGQLKENPEKVANFSDAKQMNAMERDKFLRHADNALEIILQAYKMPLFILGAKKTGGHFKKITHHEKSVISYIDGNYSNATEEELRQVLSAYTEDWSQVKQKELLQLLELAAGRQKLVTGISEVWKEAVRKRGRLLVVEKDYSYPAVHSENSDEIAGWQPGNSSNFSFIQDAVDDIIERVLENGGDVEFVNQGLLHDFQQIALILYY